MASKSGWSARTRPSWGVISLWCQLRQQVVAAAACGSPANSCGRAISRSVSLGAIADAGSLVTLKAPGDDLAPDVFAAQWRLALEALQRRQTLYAPFRRSLGAAGKTAILVIDTAAPAALAFAAIAAARRRSPARLVLIARRAFDEDLQALSIEADELIVLQPLPRTAELDVGTESQISDREAIGLLTAYRQGGPLH